MNLQVKVRKMTSEILESTNLKTCKYCEKSLPFSEFPRNENSRDGLHCWCRSCDKERINRYRGENVTQ